MCLITLFFNSLKTESLFANNSNSPKKFPFCGDLNISFKPLKAKFLSDKKMTMSISLSSTFLVGSVVEWLKYRADDQHGLGSKLICAILLCTWEKHFTTLSPAWWSWQAFLNYSNISTKLLTDSNILASPEAGRGNCLPYV